MIQPSARKRIIWSALIGLCIGWTVYYLGYQIPGVFSKRRIVYALLTWFLTSGAIFYFFPAISKIFRWPHRSKKREIIKVSLFFSLLLFAGYLIFPNPPLENGLIPDHELSVLNSGEPLAPIEITWLHNGLSDISFDALRVEGGEGKRIDESIVFTPNQSGKMVIMWEGAVWENLSIEFAGQNAENEIVVKIDGVQSSISLPEGRNRRVTKILPVSTPASSFVLPAMVVNITLFGIVFVILAVLQNVDQKYTRISEKTKRLITIISLIAILSCMTLIFLTSLNNRFLYDDYCYAASNAKDGYFQCLVGRLSQTNGRFSQMAFLCGIDSIQPWGFRLSAGFAQMFLLASFFLVHCASNSDHPIHLTIMVSSILELLVLLCTPYIQHTIYWYSGMVTVIPPLVIFNLMVFLIVTQAEKEKFPIWMGIVLFILSIVAAGFNETQTAVVIGIGVLCFSLTFLPKLHAFQSVRRAILIALMGTCVGFVIMYSLPGTISRMARYTHPATIYQLGNITVSSARASLRTIFPESLGLISYFCICIGGLLAGITVGRGNKDFKYAFRMTCVWLALGIAAYIGSFIPAAYATNANMPSRTMIVPAFFFITGLFQSAFWLGKSISPQPYFSAGWMLLILQLILTALFFFRYTPILKIYQKFADGYDERLMVIDEAVSRDFDCVEVEPIISREELYGDISNVYNGCAKYYFGIDILPKK